MPFGEFLHLLRRNGFAVGLQHYARMMTLLDTLGPECPPARVRSMMAPVFATTPDQQDRFYRLFDQWFPIFVSGTTDGLRPASGEAVGGDLTMPAPGSRRGVRRKSRLLPAMAGFAAVLLLTMLWWVMKGAPPEPAPLDVSTPAAPAPTTPVPGPQVTPVPTPPPAVSAPERRITWRAVRAGAALLIVLGFVLNEWRHYRRRRIVVERQRRERPPLVWPIRVEAASTPLVESSEFLTAARRLRERQTGERERLDIEATIRATIRALGRPVLHYVKETRPPEYLILIERASVRDHQARLFQHLIEHLAAEGVHASVYWCEEDPRICDPVGEEGPTATLVELRHKFPSHRLLMFGTGDGLIDPITGRRKAWVSDALSWPDRALLTPEAPESWGARELALAGHMVVLPGSLGGLQAAIDHFQLPARRDVLGRRQRMTVVPEPNVRDAVREIKTYLGVRGLQWVCACAVYPDLQWRLTLHLGMLPELGSGIDEPTLVKLVRLPWFRQGAIPDEARAVLLRVIEPDVERAARRTIIGLLERNPAPPETIASSRFELDLVVQKFALNSKVRAHRRELAKVARHAPRERVLSELAVLRLTEGDPTSTVAMRLPERLRDIFFQGGVSVLGLTSGARGVVAAALVAGVLFIGSGPADDRGSDLADGSRDSTSVPEPAPTSRQEAALPDSLRDVATAPPAATPRGIPPADSVQRPVDSLSTASRPAAVPAPSLGPAAQVGRPETARVPDSVRVDSSLPPVRPAEPPRRGVVIIGSTTPNATLYFESESNGPIGAPRAYLLPAAEPVRVFVRADGCMPYETTVTVAAGDTTRLGMVTLLCSPAAVDTATVRRLIEDAASMVRGMLGGRWLGLDKAPLAFANTQQQQRFVALLREYQPVNGLVTSTLFNAGGRPAVTRDSVFLIGTMRFEWRSFVGTAQRSEANFEASFARSASGLELRRVFMNIRGLP